MEPVTVLVTYKPKAGKHAELEALLRKHGAALRSTGLLSDAPVQTWKAVAKREEGGGVHYVEMLQWRDQRASDLAHQTPEVMAVWEPMGPILEELVITHLESLGADG